MHLRFGLAVTGLAAAAAFAAPAAADRLIIEDVVGQLRIETGDFDAITVEVNAETGEAPNVFRSNGEVRVDGGLPRADCDGFNLRRPRGGERQTVTVQAPRDVTLVIRARRLDVTAGAVAELDARLEGCGDWTIGAVAGDADLRNSGVGHMALGDVGGAATFWLNGTGRITAGSIGQGARLEVNGTGRVAVGAVEGPVHADVNGTGRIAIESLNGDFRGRANGTGDIRIGGGRAPNFVASANGPAADIRFDGIAGDAVLDANGFAGITIRAVEGELRRDANMASIRILERR